MVMGKGRGLVMTVSAGRFSGTGRLVSGLRSDMSVFGMKLRRCMTAEKGAISCLGRGNGGVFLSLGFRSVPGAVRDTMETTMESGM